MAELSPQARTHQSETTAPDATDGTADINSAALTANEGLLFDVLSELTKERERRAELEQRLRTVKSEKEREKRRESDASTELRDMLSALGVENSDEVVNSDKGGSADESTSSSPSTKSAGNKSDGEDEDEDEDKDKDDTTLLKAKVQSLNELISSLTSNNEALLLNRQAEAKNHISKIKRPIIDSATILSLETFPERHEKNTQLICKTYTAYEWEPDNNNLPQTITSLPIKKPSLIQKLGAKKEEARFTDRLMTFRGGDLDEMFVLEELNLGGEWAWVGGWQIDKTHSDGNGYSIVELGKAPADSPNKKSLPVTSWRRRKWYRRVLLTDYPGISRRAKYFLSSQLQIANMEMLCKKQSDQILESQTLLLEKDETITYLQHLQAANGDVGLKLEEANSLIDKLKLENRNLRNDLIFANGLNGGGGEQKSRRWTTGEKVASDDGFFKKIGRGIKKEFGEVKDKIKEKIDVHEKEKEKTKARRKSSLDLEISESGGAEEGDSNEDSNEERVEVIVEKTKGERGDVLIASC